MAAKKKTADLRMREEAARERAARKKTTRPLGTTQRMQENRTVHTMPMGTFKPVGPNPPAGKSTYVRSLWLEDAPRMGLMLQIANPNGHTICTFHDHPDYDEEYEGDMTPQAIQLAQQFAHSGQMVELLTKISDTPISDMGPGWLAGLRIKCRDTLKAAGKTTVDVKERE